MGIKGLTTFINNKNEDCMEPYELHDTNVVIDGDAILCQLYLNHTILRNGCFGGDYDKYGNTIYKFFHMLFQCKIKPYIILDGGYESRKMERIFERFKGRIDQVETLNARTESRNSTTPLFIREAFEDIALKLGINLIRCDFEGDRETANIAKELDCPVMSNDSDFYIFDVPYIPFPTVTMTVKTGSFVNPDTDETVNYRYIPCKMYKVDNFLSCVGDMCKENLPLFAALVGNDFIEGIDIVKLGIDTKTEHYIERIEAIINWLNSETKDSAIEKVLNIYGSEERETILKKFEDAINGYSFKESKYLKYLNDKPVDESADSEDDYNSYEKLTASFPKPFLEKFRKSLYPTRFMDILTQNKYYNFKPQVELRDYEHAHSVSIEILISIHKILTGSSENLVCLIRSKSEAIQEKLPLCHLDLPSYADIQTMDLDSRKKVILTILEIDESFLINSVNLFPESWHLLILTLKYMMNKSAILPAVVYSILLCKLVIDFIDPKVGFFRATDSFNKEFYSKLKDILSNKKTGSSNFKSLKSALDCITYEDALIALSRLIAFFEFNRHLKKDARLYNRKLMHSLSQFQSCLLHVKGLNQLFNMPYHDFFITECFNGTFVYNMSYNLRKREDLDDYTRYLLHKSPLILKSFEKIIKLIKEDEESVNSN